MAEYYQVELSGMSEYFNCSDCESVDGVYILGPIQQVFLGGDPIECSDAMLLATFCGDSDEPGCYGLLALQFYQSGGAYRLIVNLQIGSTPCGQRFGPERIRKRCTAAISASPSSLMERVQRYRFARERWIAASRPVRSRAEMNKLYAICLNCEHFSGHACRLCGCALHHSRGWWNKLRWVTQHCPLAEPKW